MSKYENFQDDAQEEEAPAFHHQAHDTDDEPLLAGPHFTSFQTPGATRTGQDDAMLGAAAPVPPYSPYPGPISAGAGYPPGPYMPHPVQTTSSNTTVIVQQPFQVHPPPPRMWSSRLCECGKDWSICCCGLFCLPCLQTRVAQDMGESCMVPCCVPGWLITLRTKMRLQENIPGSVLDDCCTVCCCATCALCQLAYEVKVVRDSQFLRTTSARPV